MDKSFGYVIVRSPSCWLTKFEHFWAMNKIVVIKAKIVRIFWKKYSFQKVYGAKKSKKITTLFRFYYKFFIHDPKMSKCHVMIAKAPTCDMTKTAYPWDDPEKSFNKSQNWNPLFWPNFFGFITTFSLMAQKWSNFVCGQLGLRTVTYPKDLSMGRPWQKFY